jgi:hypothetical protein
MSEQETLRLVAEVVDKWSGPLRNLRRDLQSIRPTQGNTRLAQSYDDIRRSVEGLTRGVRTGLTPVLTGLGVTTLSVAGAVAALSAAVRGFSQNTVALSYLRRETGLTIDRMRELEAFGERVGTTGDAVRGGLSSFARNMQELRHGTGDTLNSLWGRDSTGNLRKFLTELRGVGSNEEALRRVFDILDRTPNAQNRQDILTAFGLPPELGRVVGAEREKVLAEIRKNLGPLGKDGETGAKRLEDAISGLREQWRGFQNDLATGGALDAVRDILVQLREFAAANRGNFASGVRDFFREVVPAAKSVAESLISIKDTLTSLEKSAEWFNRFTGTDGTKIEPWFDLPKFLREPFGGSFGSRLRNSLGIGDDGDKKAIKEGASEGVQDGIRKMRDELRGRGGGDFGGARAIPTSLQGSWDGYRSSGAGGGTTRGTLGDTAANIRESILGSGTPGQYRPVYTLGKADLSDAVVNTIAGEAYTNNQASVDAVISNMLNRVGTKTYGPSGNLREVARAPGQYTGYRRASAIEAEFIRSRIRAVASGAVPDATGGSNEYRAAWYRGPWARRHADDGVVVGGNRFAFNPRGGRGLFSPYDDAERRAMRDRLSSTAKDSAVGSLNLNGNARVQIDLNGFPRGVRLQTEAGGIFREIELRRGRMPSAVEAK